MGNRRLLCNLPFTRGRCRRSLVSSAPSFRTKGGTEGNERAVSDVAWLWHLMRSVPIHVHAIQSGDVSPFALSLTLHAPEEAWVNPPNLLKPWFDAVVSAFQAHNGDDLPIVSERLSKKLNVAQSDISAYLMS